MAGSGDYFLPGSGTFTFSKNGTVPGPGGTPLPSGPRPSRLCKTLTYVMELSSPRDPPLCGTVFAMGHRPYIWDSIIMLCYLNIAHLADKVKGNIYLDILLVLWYGSIMEKQAETKFWTRVKKGPGPESCWLWTACTVAGYGRIRVNDAAVYAHRFSWEIHNGPIPAGLWVCHKCDVRSCVNPAHLFLSTATGNAADRHAKGRDGKVNDTHCARGHEFTPENTGRQPGGRYCRACASAARSRLYKIHRAEGKER